MPGASVTEEIKDRLDIVEVIGGSVKLRRSGKNYTGFCPFHPNSHTPAFVVFPESGTWRCFGACNEGGDLIKFVMKKEGLDFKEALRMLAARAGVELHERDAGESADEETHARLRSLLEAATSYYRHQLTATPAGAPVLEYLVRRGLQPATLEVFEVGYAPLPVSVVAKRRFLTWFSSMAATARWRRRGRPSRAPTRAPAAGRRCQG